MKLHSIFYSLTSLLLTLPMFAPFPSISAVVPWKGGLIVDGHISSAQCTHLIRGDTQVSGAGITTEPSKSFGNWNQLVAGILPDPKTLVREISYGFDNRDVSGDGSAVPDRFLSGMHDVDFVIVNLPEGSFERPAHALLQDLLNNFQMKYAGGQKGVLGIRFQNINGEYDVFGSDRGKNDSEMENQLVPLIHPSVKIFGNWVHRFLEGIDPRAHTELNMKKIHFRWSGTPAGGWHTDDSQWTIVWVPSGETLEFMVGDQVQRIGNNQVLFFRGDRVSHRGVEGPRLVYTFMFYEKEMQPAVGFGVP